MEEKLTTIKNTTQDLLAKMGFGKMAVEIINNPEGIVVCVNAPDGGLLIGQGGETLIALQHLVRLLSSKKNKDETISFSLDINDYRRHRTEILKDFAVEKANSVAKEKRSFYFQPMTSYERRIIHLALKDRQDIICESEGMGAERHIVLKPI